MARLPRVTQKIFASSAPANQITAFGTIKAGAPSYTTNISQIMNTAYVTGWSDAVEDDYAPYRQDRNAIDLTTTQQIAYLLCEGIPEYDSGTVYYFGQIAKVIDGTSVKIYMSIANEHSASVTDTTKWRLFMTIDNAGVLQGISINSGTFNNPSLTGTVTVPNQDVSDNSQKAANTSFVKSCLSGAVSTIATANLDGSKAVVSNSSGKIVASSVTSTELGYLSGVTSSVQTQINAKFNSSDIVTVQSLPATTVPTTYYFVTG